MIEVQQREVIFPDAKKDLALLTMPWGPQSSLRGAYGGMLHGRDSLVTARNTLCTHPELAKIVLKNVSSLMGVTKNPRSEEEKGKIHHEARFRPADSGQNPENVFSYAEVSGKWGGEVDISIEGKEGKGVVYYGSVDATAKYLILLGKYVSVYGTEILDQEVTRRDGKKYKIRECAEESYDLLERWITSDSKRGLLEYKRANDEGIENQILRDSITSVLNITEGKATLLNHRDRVATIDLQAEAYEALLKAPVVFQNESAMDPKVTKWLDIAKDLQKNTLEKFWDPELNYFASALDYDSSGIERKSRYITSMPGYLLGSGMLAGIPESERRMYLNGLGDMLISPRFMTDVGVRGAATDMAGLLEYLDYHGPAAVWGTETKRIGDGFRKEGFTGVASQIYIRFKNAILISGSHREFWFVDPRTNEVCYVPVTAGETPSGLRRIIATNSPEETQALTAAPSLDLDKEGVDPRIIPITGSWEDITEQRWLENIPKQKLITDPEVIRHKREMGTFEIDLRAGQEAEARFRMAA